MKIGLASLLLGWTLVLPTSGIILAILGFKKEPAGRRMAAAGTILNIASMTIWITIAIIGTLIMLNDNG